MFDLKAIEKDMEINRRERRKFIDSWIDFMQKNPNSVWSKEHAEFVDMVYGKSGKE